MALSKTTQDHDEIQQWAEKRGGKPAEVAATERGGQTGIIRIEFPGAKNANDSNLKEISWDEFFEKFDSSGLALVYQEVTKEGAESNFNKLVKPENASGSAKKSASKKTSAKTSAKKVSTKTAPTKSAPAKAVPAKKVAASKGAATKTAAKKVPAKKAAATKATGASKSSGTKASANKATKSAGIKASAAKKTAKKPSGKK